MQPRISALRPILLVLTALLPTRVAAAPPPSIALDGVSFAIQLRATGDLPSAVRRGASEAPSRQPSPRLVEGPRSYLLQVRGERRRLPLAVRQWRLVAESTGPAVVFVFKRDDFSAEAGEYARVDEEGRVRRFTIAGPVPDRHIVCGGRYLVAVARRGGTVIHDLQAERLVMRDATAGIHDRADTYGGPACAPDGRLVAIPDTFAKAVHFFRLEDGRRLGAWAFAPDGVAPGVVSWGSPPDRAIVIQTVADPIAVNPPK